MDNPFLTITNALDEAEVSYELLEHEPVHTSEEAAKVRDGLQETGAKSLLLKSEAGFVVAVLQGNARLDIKKITEYLGASKKPRFAKPEEVEEQMGCQVGACYPMAYLVQLRTIIDEPFTRKEYISFNPGVHNKTITMPMKDYLDLADPEIARISQ